ncbi:MAG: hydrogenase iron-sulfur subunit, partial [Chloroflexi bacterium]|nr:hydrogenase iron-sulfur subunit [Chloroflexota bacterium]
MTASIQMAVDAVVFPSAAIVGNNIFAVQTALSLAQMGIDVKLVTDSLSFGCNDATAETSVELPPDQRYFWPLLLRTVSHPLVTLYTGAQVESVKKNDNGFTLDVLQRPRFVQADLCTGCGRCQAECSVRLTTLVNGQKIKHGAIHKPLLAPKAVPSAYVIDKNGMAPCRVECPLGINVQGFISLLANDKTERAAELIAEAAPLGGILGRVCRHPCEANCSRGKLDTPVSIRALHRYAADAATAIPGWRSATQEAIREGRIAIIGSGPAGLTAAWELKRRGYSPVVFESHSVVGGMLATGIPRFRLPREVREKEIEAIRSLGIDIRAGITVGRDITFTYLRERGFKAFFLAIGALRNNRLNIPGEELDGVVDCMSLLLTLNLKVDTFVGANVVIIGDGNSAIDSARAVIRWNKAAVKILSWTVPEELTAAEEEVEEAIMEGVTIEYQAMPVEILGEGGRVTGVRCRKTELTNEIMPNGRHRPRPIPETDFVIEADHVVVAIGQSPDASQLGIDGLSLRKGTGVIKVNPLTLETSIPGVFAGGDCVTGPNNVVEAMAAGLRAAESIDRYLQKRDLAIGRTLEPEAVAEVDIESIEAIPHVRATMPAISLQDRVSGFEETTTGLSAEAALQEAQRCLNCAMCSQCLECVAACQLDAVSHDDVAKCTEIGAQTVIRFIDDNPAQAAQATKCAWSTTQDGITIVHPQPEQEITAQLNRSTAVAVRTALKIKPKLATMTEPKEADARLLSPDVALSSSVTGDAVIGVFLCCCGDSISSVIDFSEIAKHLASLPSVAFIMEMPQACTAEGASFIAQKAVDASLTGLVVASCRCCNLGQVCYSCTDRRAMCLRNLREFFAVDSNVQLEFVNIREQCAWVHSDDRNGATQKALRMVSAAVSTAACALPASRSRNDILPSALIIGGGVTNIVAAKALVSQGYGVEVLTRQPSRLQRQGSLLLASLGLSELTKADIAARPWPSSLALRGVPGKYEALLGGNQPGDKVTVGAVMIDIEGLNKKPSCMVNSNSGELLSRLMSRLRKMDISAGVRSDLLREVTLRETAGLFLLSLDADSSLEGQVMRGLTAAARVSSYLSQGSVTSRAMAVDIDAKNCRGCGDCAVICPYIEMRARESGVPYAFVDKALCYGCGMCVSSCDTGAIIQQSQSDKHIELVLRSLLSREQASDMLGTKKLAPDVLVFACNWDGWSCLEAASYMELSYPASVKVVRIRCLSRLHAGLILKAFELGAEGVMLLGCGPGKCHFESDSGCVLAEYEKAQQMLELFGMPKERLTLSQLPAFDGYGFVEQVAKLVRGLRKHSVKRAAVAASSRSHRTAAVNAKR